MALHAITIPGRSFEAELDHDKSEKNVGELGLANTPVLPVPSLGGIPLKYLS